MQMIQTQTAIRSITIHEGLGCKSPYPQVVRVGGFVTVTSVRIALGLS